MADPIAVRRARDKEADQQNGHRRSPPNSSPRIVRENGLSALHSSAGNQVVTQALKLGVKTGRPIPKGLPSFVRKVLQSPGRPLDPETRSLMESRFGYGFSGVRIHADAKAGESARTLHAQAYTVNNNIVFGAKYTPYARAGQYLLGHELAHVVQQGRGGSVTQSLSGNSALETAAEEAAAALLQNNGTINVSGSSAPALACRIPDEERRKQKRNTKAWKKYLGESGERRTAKERRRERKEYEKALKGYFAKGRDVSKPKKTEPAGVLPKQYVRPRIESSWRSAVGKSEASAMHEASGMQAGLYETRQHHVFPQEIRNKGFNFEKHGFTRGTKRDIDNFVVRMPGSEHETQHGGGNWKMGRKEWRKEWNRLVIRTLKNAESAKRKWHRNPKVKLRWWEVRNIVFRLMDQRGIPRRFERWKAKDWPRRLRKPRREGAPSTGYLATRRMREEARRRREEGTESRRKKTRKASLPVRTGKTEVKPPKRTVLSRRIRTPMSAAEAARARFSGEGRSEIRKILRLKRLERRIAKSHRLVIGRMSRGKTRARGAAMLIAEAINTTISSFFTSLEQKNVQKELDKRKAEIAEAMEPTKYELEKKLPPKGVLVGIFYERVKPENYDVGARSQVFNTFKFLTFVRAETEFEGKRKIFRVTGADTVAGKGRRILAHTIWLPSVYRLRKKRVSDIVTPYRKVSLATFFGSKAKVQKVSWGGTGFAGWYGFNNVAETEVKVPSGVTPRFIVLRPPARLSRFVGHRAIQENIPIKKNGTGDGRSIPVVDLDPYIFGDVTAAMVFPVDDATEKVFGSTTGLYDVKHELRAYDFKKIRWVRPENIRILGKA